MIQGRTGAQAAHSVGTVSLVLENHTVLVLSLPSTDLQRQLSGHR